LIKVGLFGDSFAHLDKSKNGKSYIEYVNEHSGIHLIPFGVSGSSMYYSYVKFLENHKDFDKIIYIATHSGRLWIKNATDEKSEHVFNLVSAESVLKNFIDLNEYNKKILKSVVDYYTYIHNAEEHDIYHDFMKKSILEKRNDTLLIDGFNFTGVTTKNLSLMDVARLDFIEKDRYIFGNFDYIDMRPNHLNEYNTVVFANKIINWILYDNFEFDNLDDFKSTTGIASYYSTI